MSATRTAILSFLLTVPAQAGKKKEFNKGEKDKLRFLLRKWEN